MLLLTGGWFAGEGQAIFPDGDCWDSRLLLGPRKLGTGILGQEDEPETLKA